MKIEFFSEFLRAHFKTGRFIQSFRRQKFVNHNVSLNIYSRLFSRTWSLVISWINPNGRY